MPENRERQPSLILDATVLSNFALVGRLQLLERLYAGRVCTTLSVVEEIHQGVRAGYAALAGIDEVLGPLRSDGWLMVVTPESAREQGSSLSQMSSLGLGEASCLAVAESRDMTLATDDRAARRQAAKRGVRLTGTVGILARAVRDGHLSLTDANGLLRQMIQHGYRSPVESLDDLV